jgi:hypothetical protein
LMEYVQTQLKSDLEKLIVGLVVQWTSFLILSMVVILSMQ